MLEWLAEPEISEFETAIMNQNVVGLQVPMHYIVLAQDAETLEYLPQELDGFLLGESALPLEEHVESAAIAKLVDEIEIICGLKHVDVLDDEVRFLLELRQNVHFVDGALLQFGNVSELAGLNDLDGHFLQGFHVDGAIHLGVDPFTQALLQ